MGLKLPPAFVNTPASDVFNLELPDSVFRTLAVLHGLAWQTKGERTPPTTVLELASLRGLRERQMYTHLCKLKELRRIRVENLGGGRLVIYPLRWEPGAALPTDDPSSLTEAEIAALTETDKPPGEVTAKNCSGTAKNCSQQHVVVDSCLKDSESESETKQQQHEQYVTAKNCSKVGVDSGQNDLAAETKQPDQAVTAKNCSEQGVDSGRNDLAAGSKQPDHRVTAKNCSKERADSGQNDLAAGSKQPDQPVTAKNCSELIQAIAAIFINDGDALEVACDKAANLINKHGVECCQRQLSYFPRRCELARASEDGLRNPSGLFIRSVQGDWTAPAQTQKKSPNTWYSQEEFDDLIEH